MQQRYLLVVINVRLVFLGDVRNGVGCFEVRDHVLCASRGTIFQEKLFFLRGEGVFDGRERPR